MLIDISNIKSSKLGFGSELRSEVKDLILDAEKIKGNERLDVILNNSDYIVNNGNKKSLENLKNSIIYIIKEC